MKFIGALVGVFAFGSPVFAGTLDGGGGPSIVCRGADRAIQSVQLLDLYEGKMRFDLDIPVSGAAVELQLAQAFARLKSKDSLLALDVADLLTKLQQNIRFLPPGVVMAPGVDLGDSYAALIPDGCELSYVAYYEANGVLRISRTLFDHLNNTDKAALFMHEALYKAARDLGRQTNSADSRQVNGFLFSTAQDFSPIQAAMGRLYWPGIFNDSLYPNNFVYQPVVLDQNSSVMEITVAAPKDMIAPVTTIVNCHRSNGSVKLLVKDSRDLMGNTTIRVSTEGCRAYAIHVNTNHLETSFMKVTAKLGSQTIFSGRTARDIEPRTTSLHVGLPVYVTAHRAE